MNRKRGTTTRGFTLIELVVSLALVGLMAMMALPLAELADRRQREAALREALRDIRTAIDHYRLAVDQGLIQRSVGSTGYPPSLAVLAQGVPNQLSATRERLVFLRRVPRDPFNTELSMPPEASWLLRSYASPADAPAPGDDVFDVLSHASGVGLNGVPYSEW